MARIEKCGVYIIENICNGKIYVGSSKDIKRRHTEHFYELKKGCHVNRHLQRSFDKYGEKNFKFQIIEYCNESERFLKEAYWVNKLDTVNCGYNMFVPSDNGGHDGSLDIRKRIGKGMREYYLGRPISDDEYEYLCSLPRKSRNGDLAIPREEYLKRAKSSGIKVCAFDKETGVFIKEYDSKTDICKEFNSKCIKLGQEYYRGGYVLIESSKCDKNNLYPFIRKKRRSPKKH